MSSLRLTLEQSTILQACSTDQTSSFTIEALAGTGKTSTIIELLPKLSGEVLLLAYNKSIQRELMARVPAALKLSVFIATVHSFGLGVLKRNGFSKAKVDGGKLHFLFRNILQTKPSFRANFNDRLAGTATIVKLVSHAKNAGFGLGGNFPDPEDEGDWMRLIDHFRIDEELEEHSISIPDAITMAQFLLKENNRSEAMIDFDDMIYFPLLKNLRIPQHSHVIIDEAQDISATRAELASRACAERGRMIAVGDRHQAIYGFTGADAAALDNITRRHQATILPLTICWRCDAAIIAEAQRLVPAIQPRPNANPGTVDELPIDSFINGPIPLGSAILCRLNRPNVAVCLELIRRGLPAKIEGRDLGRSLLAHMKKAQPLYATIDLDQLVADLADYKENEMGSLIRRGKKSQAAYLADEVDAAALIVERSIETGGTAFRDVEALVGSLFADDIPSRNLITLSSIHKAKGREWPRVFRLGADDYQPFFMAVSDWEIEQEHNLSYVEITRAEQWLTKVTGVDSWLKARQSG